MTQINCIPSNQPTSYCKLKSVHRKPLTVQFKICKQLYQWKSILPINQIPIWRQRERFCGSASLSFMEPFTEWWLHGFISLLLLLQWCFQLQQVPLFFEKALKTHSALPAQHQMADRHSWHLTGQHSTAFAVGRQRIKADQIFACSYKSIQILFSIFSHGSNSWWS